jgi:hypothetical protein
MKFLTTLAVALATSIPALGSEAGGYKSESQSVSEVFTSTITKVYSAADGDYSFAAYAVTWRNQEVIVTTYQRHDDLTVGDTVRCEMRQLPSVLAGNKGRMTFSLLGRPGDVTAAVVLNPTPAEELARLERVATEVRRRRAEREASSGNTESNSPKTPNKAPEPTTGTVTPRATP